MSAPDKEASADDLVQYFVSVKAGDFIFREADGGADMFIIRNGHVELLKQHADRARQVALLEVGDFFGEMSLLEGLPREVSARAVGPVDLLRIDGATFDRIVQEAPEVPVRMLRKLSRRFRDYQEQESRALAIAVRPLAAAPGAAEARAVDVRASHPPPASAPGARRGSPVLVDPISKAQFALAAGHETTIGRPDRQTGFIPDIDITPLDAEQTLSRRHAKIVARDGDYYVREEKSTRNGTFVNGVRLQTGVDVKLVKGDKLRFGLVETVFQPD